MSHLILSDDTRLQYLSLQPAAPEADIGFFPSFFFLLNNLPRVQVPKSDVSIESYRIETDRIGLAKENP